MKEMTGTLTPTEERVAELLVASATIGEAADTLGVSFHTVRTHVRSIYRKLGIGSRVELARRLWERELVAQTEKAESRREKRRE